MTRKEISSLAIVVVIGLLLQVGFIALDCSQSPYKTAVSYMQARYGLSPSMARYLCGDSNKSCDANKSSKCRHSEVQDFVYSTTAMVAERGFDKSVAKYTLSHIETHTEYLDNATAVVHLTATRRMAINPLYAFVTRLFNIGKTDKVDESIRLELQNGQWKVCRSSVSML